MKAKNFFLKKKYNSKNLKVLFYFLNSAFLKANQTRRFQRLCETKNIKILFLPSSFKYSDSPISHGPSMVCLLAKNFGFSEISFAENLQTLSAKNKGQDLFFDLKIQDPGSTQECAENFLQLLAHETKVMCFNT